jgi:hypothetical protein
METFFTKIDKNGYEDVYMQSGDIVWSIPKDESNSDYQAYLRWLNGEEENGTIS